MDLGRQPNLSSSLMLNSSHWLAHLLTLYISPGVEGQDKWRPLLFLPVLFNSALVVMFPVWPSVLTVRIPTHFFEYDISETSWWNFLMTPTIIYLASRLNLLHFGDHWSKFLRIYFVWYLMDKSSISQQALNMTSFHSFEENSQFPVYIWNQVKETFTILNIMELARGGEGKKYPKSKL